MRARGREELARALAQRGFSPESTRAALGRLERESWLNDSEAARSFVRARSERYGRARIERELSARGFSKEVAAKALSEADVREEGSLADAFSRLWASSAKLPKEKRRRRVWSALLRRGFAVARISEIMKDSGETDEIDRSP